MIDSILFDAKGNAATRVVIDALTQSGFYVLRSFDLCSTVFVECHFAVLLIYGDHPARLGMTSGRPANQTRFERVRDAMTTPDPQLTERVMTLLTESSLSIQKDS